MLHNLSPSEPFEIDVAERFSDMPYGRSEKDSVWNGRKFREEVLLPELKKHEYIEVNLNNTLTCGSSFTDEAFAGLVMYEGFSPSEVLRRVIIKYRFKSIVNNIRRYIQEAKPEK